MDSSDIGKDMEHLINIKAFLNLFSSVLLLDKIWYFKSLNLDLDRYYILNNGAKMPKVGLGTYGMNDEDEIYQAIAELGYRHIDTGSM